MRLLRDKFLIFETPSGHQASCGYGARAAILSAGSDKHRRRRMFRPAAGDIRARNARDSVALDGRDVTDAFSRSRRGRKNPRAVCGDSPRIAERRPRLARRDNTCPAGATYGILGLKWISRCAPFAE